MKGANYHIVDGNNNKKINRTEKEYLNIPKELTKLELNGCIASKNKKVNILLETN